MLESRDILPEIYDFIHNGSKIMNNEIIFFIDLVKYVLTGIEMIRESS